MLKKSHAVFYLAIVVFVAIFNAKELSAQSYSFPEIKENFLVERPQTGNIAIRNESFRSIDALFNQAYPQVHPDSESFFRLMLEKAILEIKSETVTKGATIWLIYNHGFVVKTPSVTFAFDLNDFYQTGLLPELADYIDVLFVSHIHRDHYSPALIGKMIQLNKPVIGPAEFPNIPIGMNSGDYQKIANLEIVAHYGLHSVPVRQFEVTTPEGIKILHTGDNQDTGTLPDVTNIDILLVNCWVNDSGNISMVEGLRKAINIINPKVALPGHMMELGHIGGETGGPVEYQNPIESDDGTLSSEYYILGWGERYHFMNSSNDSIVPSVADNLSAEVHSDTITVTWDAPQSATDGDGASYYRVVANDSCDFLVTANNLDYSWKSLKANNFKVYSYDDCGNQSANYAEIDVPISVSYLRAVPHDAYSAPGKICSVNVIVGNISDLGDFQFDMVYDTEIIKADQVMLGDFPGSAGRNISVTESTIDNSGATGKLTFGCSSSGSNPGPDGSGVLAKIVFVAQAEGVASLNIQNAQLNNTAGQAIAINSNIDGYIEISPEQNWVPQTSDTENRLNCVDAVSDLVAWVAGDNTTVLRTEDGGETWQSAWNGPDTLRFWSISGIDNKTALVAATGGRWSDGTNITYIFRTDDGGANWIKVFEHPLGFLDDVTMFNATNGFAIGAESDGIFLMVETKDGGNTWNYSPSAPAAMDREYPLNRAIDWLDSATCWFGTSQSHIFHTSDGGNTWEATDVPALNKIFSIAFDKNGVGLAAAYFDLARTLDNGAAWETLQMPEFETMTHIVEHQGVFWGMVRNVIYKSTDHGATWEKQMTTTSNIDIRFASFISNENGDFGWGVGKYGFIASYKNSYTKVEEDHIRSIPTNFSLYQNYPNPFNPTTEIRFTIPALTHVSLKIFNLMGQEIATLMDAQKTAGTHAISWDGKNRDGHAVSSGVYIYRLKTDNFNKAMKMLLIR